MIWQDIVFSIGQWIFIIALIPSILGKDKPAFSSSIMTGGILTIFGATYISISLWMAGVSTLISAIPWFILAIQKYLLNKKQKAGQSQ